MWCFDTFQFKMCFVHSGVQFLISHMASWLRTRRFSEPTFRPSRATKYWKKPSVLRLSYLFARLHLLPSDFLHVDLLPGCDFPSVHIVGNLVSKCFQASFDHITVHDIDLLAYACAVDILRLSQAKWIMYIQSKSCLDYICRKFKQQLSTAAVPSTNFIMQAAHGQMGQNLEAYAVKFQCPITHWDKPFSDVNCYSSPNLRIGFHVFFKENF